jgi:hypothetical protein
MFRMSRFINVEFNIKLMCMPPTGGKKFFKIRISTAKIRQSSMEEENTCKTDFERGGGLRSSFHRFDGPERTEEPLNTLRSFSDSGSNKARVVGGVPIAQNFKHISIEPPASKFSFGRLSKSDSSMLERKVRDPKMFTVDLVRRGNTSARFLSVKTYTGRMVGNNRNDRLLLKQSLGNGNHGERLSESGKLELFRALLKKPLATLELRTCFGVSKQALKGLCKKGLVAEVWGPGTVGLRFGLTRKGKAYLAELRAAAKCDQRISRRGAIRLKNRF